ncbi:MAG: Hsp70 family protein [Actinomycetota bacterium]|nr:Hsp70 family protein [Actinomycetota bacterium]
MSTVPGKPLAMAEEIIFGGHGYNFFRAIEDGKIAVSDTPQTTIAFSRTRVSLSEPLTRHEFELLIGPNLDRVGEQIDRALTDANVNAHDVDLVIRTGGSSRIPAFVQSLAARFGPDKLAERDAFATVALGLGIRACQLWS